MSNDLITPENLSVKLLKSVFDDALMDVSMNEDGDLWIQDIVNCLVTFNENVKSRITLLNFFRLKSTANRTQVLECLNAINREYVIVRAYVTSGQAIAFEYNIYIQGGITKKNLVLAIKQFCRIPREALREYGKDIAV